MECTGNGSVHPRLFQAVQLQILFVHVCVCCFGVNIVMVRVCARHEYDIWHSHSWITVRHDFLHTGVQLSYSRMYDIQM